MSMASTWDPSAVYKWAAAMGKEFHQKNTQIQLGPGLNVNRLP
jgi:beta-glucosidase-like glycosyl hydrolase